MPSVYITKYLPFENNINGYPWLYSGSDTKDDPKYFGSVQSTRVLEFTDGLPLVKWWKREIKNHPEHFEKIVVIQYFCVSQKGIRSIESRLQTLENHAGDSKYFNYTNHDWNCDSTVNKFKGIPLEKQVGFENSKLIRKKRSESMKETRKHKNWSTKGCIDSVKLQAGITSHWESLTTEEKSKRLKKTRKTYFDKLKQSGSLNPLKKWIYVVPGLVITNQNDTEIFQSTGMQRAKIKSRCKNNASIITEKQATTDPFLLNIANCVGKQFLELGFRRLQIEEWKNNEIL